MLKKIVETLVAGAIGMVALYGVGRLAYQAGQETAKEECRYQALCKERARLEKQEAPTAIQPQPQTPGIAIVSEDLTRLDKGVKWRGTLGMMLGAKKLFGNRKTVIGGLMHEPEAHKVEAFVEGEELQIRVKRKEAS